MQGAIGIGFMQTLSYALSLPLRCLGIGLSIPVVIAGKGYDLLFKKSPPEPTPFWLWEDHRVSGKRLHCSMQSQ